MSQYLTQEWLARRNQILSKDNYTCQNCFKFNPAIGRVEIRDKDGYLEIHEYHAYDNLYYIRSEKNSFTLQIDFGYGKWLVLPKLQVHHRRYIEGLKIWEFSDNDLITYCKECHTLGHTLHKIPIYNQLGVLINKIGYKPEDIFNNENDNFIPWHFVNKIDGVYSYTDIHPTIRYFIKEGMSEQKIEELAFEMLKDFLSRYLPDYVLK